MEAKDAVMSAGKLCDKVCLDHRTATSEAKDCRGLDCEECQLKAQAEISFKAGVDEEAKRGIERCAMTYDDGKRAGIKEVVEWLEKNCLGCQSNTPGNEDEYLGFHKASYQAQLKDWGVKDESNNH